MQLVGNLESSLRLV